MLKRVTIMKENPNCKKVKGSYMLLISCGFCKTQLVKYQKLGKGGLLRMHIDRIVESSVDLTQDLTCSNCHNIIGSKVILKSSNKPAYKMTRSSFNTKKI